MKHERSIIVMTLLWLDYLVHDLDNCNDDTPTETGLIILQMMLSAYQSHSIPYPFFRRTSGAM